MKDFPEKCILLLVLYKLVENLLHNTDFTLLRSKRNPANQKSYEEHIKETLKSIQKERQEISRCFLEIKWINSKACVMELFQQLSGQPNIHTGRNIFLWHDKMLCLVCAEFPKLTIKHKLCASCLEEKQSRVHSYINNSVWVKEK